LAAITEINEGQRTVQAEVEYALNQSGLIATSKFDMLAHWQKSEKKSIAFTI
jgi:hypothetical protein